MENNIFIKNNIEKVNRGEYTDFLNINEYNKIVSVLNKLHIKYEVFSSFDDCSKKIIYITKPNICLLEFISNEELKHSDILGMLFSNNINPSKYGDILVKDNHYYLITFDTIKYYLMNNLINIKNNLVVVEEKDIEVISDYKLDYEEFNILVSSLRLDNVVSTITNTSRNNTDILFKNKFILINYEIMNKKTYNINEGDIISIRKHGKYIFDSIIKKTNKDKYILKIKKYK